MGCRVITPGNELEHMLFDENIEPKALPLSLLEGITNGFSDDEEIGRGGFAVVYKGMLTNGMVAVKKLNRTLDIHEKKFSDEISCLMKTKHKNIVRFLGYCSDTQGKMVDYDGDHALEYVGHKLLCFEYLREGSLDKKITDASHGLGWRRRYEIINGICDGLYYLHQNHIIHLDLKPANILLDDHMTSKIADFGLSRFLDEKQSQTITLKLMGTMGYSAPESAGRITYKSDIYSLGVIIMEILTGKRGYADIENVLESWRNMLEESHRDKQLVQIRVCTEIAIECSNSNPAKRPDMQRIVDKLGATKYEDDAIETGTSSSSSVMKLAAVPLGLTIGSGNTTANANQSLSSVPDDGSNMQQETSSNLEEVLTIRNAEETIAIEEQNIVNILSQTITEEFVLLPIYGIRGIGKTTLARLVFNDTQFQDYSRVWVYVSYTFNLNKIGNSIISQLTNMHSHIADTQIICNYLTRLFSGKRVIIVLDDLWEKDPIKLDKLKHMLRLGRGSKVIIITTRDEAIARKICDPPVTPYNLEILTDDMCWKIIKQKTSFKDRDDQKQLEQTGMDIAIKCGGVALAAQSIGYMLRHMMSDEWESVRDSYVWNLSSSVGASVLASLMLSYNHLSDALKLCFSYCAVFPKGHNIVKYDLIHQWIALGFPEKSAIFDSMQLCEGYMLHNFWGCPSFNIPRKNLRDGRQEEHITLFTMPDLVHDLARNILADQVSDKGNGGSDSCRYALVTDCSKPLQLSVNSPENIKVLRFLDCGKIELLGVAFSAAKCLHVLDLSECLIQNLPDSIGQLKQLRFLHAPRIQDRMITTCITELSELSYLNLGGSRNILALPESIGDMKGLVHVDLSGCNGIHELPLSFTELKQLVHLDLSDCSMSISEAFAGFTKLQYLNLSVQLTADVKNRRRLLDVIRHLIKLKYLNLSGCMKAMAPLSEDQICNFLDSISILHNLEHLDMSKNVEISSIPESIGNLRKLHTLNISGCFNLKKLPRSMSKMVSLKVLTLDESLQLIYASLMDFVVHVSSDKCSSNIIQLEPSNPNELMIDRLENVKSAEEALAIKLTEKQNIVDLAFQWTVAAERFVDDKEVLETLVPPSSVQRLSIAGYSSVSIPDWLTGMSLYLPNLKQISLCDFPVCKKLPQLGYLPNLRSLDLCRMGALEEWNTAYGCGEEGANELMFPKLNELSIKECAKLTIKPCLPRAMSLTIVDCDNVLSTHISASPSSPITDLVVGDSKVPMYEWRLLHQLPALRSLSITSCIDLTATPDIMQQLSSLESLTLSQEELPRWLIELKFLQALSLCECRSMTSLPRWLGELTSLKKFVILCCDEIGSLPDSIQQLTKLEFLRICGCPTLRKWCESKENKAKLAKISQKDIQ